VSNLKERIEVMHRRDVQIAWAFVVGLWLAVIFVAIAKWSLAPGSAAWLVLLFGGAIVLISTRPRSWQCSSITAKIVTSCMGSASSFLMPPAPRKGDRHGKVCTPRANQGRADHRGDRASGPANRIAFRAPVDGACRIKQITKSGRQPNLGKPRAEPGHGRRWNQLGFADAASAHDIITARFDYSFSTLNLIVMIVVGVGYFLLMLKLSEQEYRDVIAEKFGDGK
jgi:hypothetical protein